VDESAVRKLLLGLPGVEEVEGWAGQPAFKVRGKGFVYLSEDSESVYLKALREEQEALCAEQPEIYTAWWASGRFGWIQAELADADDELPELLVEAWRLTAPKSLVAQGPR
jgi:hypothetical protein